MEQSVFLRVAIISLFLIVVAAGYFFLTGKFLTGSIKLPTLFSQKVQVQPTPQQVLGENTQVQTSTPSADLDQSAKPSSAYTRIAQRSQGSIETLPKTGSPLFLIATILLSFTVTGWGLRKFPN